jgi:hypothetical protein
LICAVCAHAAADIKSTPKTFVLMMLISPPVEIDLTYGLSTLGRSLRPGNPRVKGVCATCQRKMRMS